MHCCTLAYYVNLHRHDVASHRKANTYCSRSAWHFFPAYLVTWTAGLESVARCQCAEVQAGTYSSQASNRNMIFPVSSAWTCRLPARTSVKFYLDASQLPSICFSNGLFLFVNIPKLESSRCHQITVKGNLYYSIS